MSSFGNVRLDSAAVPQCCAEGLALPADLKPIPAAAPPVRGGARWSLRMNGKAEPFRASPGPSPSG